MKFIMKSQLGLEKIFTVHFLSVNLYYGTGVVWFEKQKSLYY